MEEFTALYKANIGLSYICTGRAGMVKEKHAQLLADSGCRALSFGIETGNEELRIKILKKNITNNDILECANILKNANIEVQTSNMFCLPGETIDDAISTIDLNMKIGTNYMFTTIFLPFPKTELAQYCIEKNMLDKNYSFDNMPNSFLEKTVLIKSDSEYLINMHKVAHLCIRFPRLKPFLIYLARKIRFKQLFFCFWLVSTIIRFKEERNLTLTQAIKYLWSYRKGL